MFDAVGARDAGLEPPEIALWRWPTSSSSIGSGASSDRRTSRA